MHARSRTLVAAAVLALAGGCKLGPDYKRPEVPVPETWREVETKEQEARAGTAWWELFEDPALVELIRTALADNKDLKIAVERIEEARARYGFQKADLYPRFDVGASAGAVGVS